MPVPVPVPVPRAVPVLVPVTVPVSRHGHLCAASLGSQKVSNGLELEIQEVVSSPVLIWGTELRASRRAGSHHLSLFQCLGGFAFITGTDRRPSHMLATLWHWAIAPTLYFFSIVAKST